MRPGDRVLYVPPDPTAPSRFGELRTISGASAEILFDGRRWPTWAPLGRLFLVRPGPGGWQQVALVTLEGEAAL